MEEREENDEEDGGQKGFTDMDVILALCRFSASASSSSKGLASTPEDFQPPLVCSVIYPPPPPLKLQCDPPSSKARFKCYSTLVRLCARYGRSPTEHHISVCEGRKTVHMLLDGEVDHVACFIMNETPGASFRTRRRLSSSLNSPKSEMQPSYLRSVVVPNGWKVAVVDEGHLFTAEARISPLVDSQEESQLQQQQIEYRFTSVNDSGEEERPAGWYSNLCEAFRKVSQPLEDKSQTKTHRYNGKLLLGLHYHNPQLKVLAFVSKQYEEGKFNGNSPLKSKVEEWMRNCESDRISYEQQQQHQQQHETDHDNSSNKRAADYLHHPSPVSSAVVKREETVT